MSNIDYQALAAQLLAKARGEKPSEQKQSEALALVGDNDSSVVSASHNNIPDISLENHGNKIIVALDSMQLGFIQACLRKYDLRHNKLIESREKGKGINKGSLMHEFLRYYYTAKRDGAFSKQAVEEGITHGRKKIPEFDLEDEDITDVTRKFIEYGNKYTNEAIEILDIEQPFSLDLYEDDHLVIVWEGIRDLDVRLAGEDYVWDHKTASRKGNWDELHNQLIGYAYSRPCKLLIINEIVFVKGVGEGFYRHPLTMSRDIINLWRESTIASVKNYLAYAAIDYYPPNVHSCNQMFGCGFKDFCKADERTREWLMKTQYHYTTKWDPFQRG